MAVIFVKKATFPTQRSHSFTYLLNHRGWRVKLIVPIKMHLAYYILTLIIIFTMKRPYLIKLPQPSMFLPIPIVSNYAPLAHLYWKQVFLY